MSIYGPSPIKKRARRTKAELERLDEALAEIVWEIEPATVRQVFYQAVVRGLVPKDEAKGYKLVQRRLVKLREEGVVPYGWITDNVPWSAATTAMEGRRTTPGWQQSSTAATTGPTLP